MNKVLELTLLHLYIVCSSVLIASIIAIPIAILVYKKNIFPNTLIYISSLLQSFPALGLFSLLVPIIGIGINTVIFSLVLYALLPIFYSTITALKNINPEYYEISEILNLSSKKFFYKVELPIILKDIVGGIKLATIYTISFATIGTLVGAGGLGDLIYLGLQSMNMKMTILGLVPLMIMTVATNIIFNFLEKSVTTKDYLKDRK